MKKRSYKTLRGLIRSAEQLNFNNLKSGRFCHKSGGWACFTLPEPERVKAFELLASVVYSRNTERGAYLMRRYSGQGYGILNRLCFDKHTSCPEYIAGQDYTGEIRTIQRILRDNN